MVKIKSNYLFKSLFPRENHTKTGLEKILTLIICFSIFLTVIETEKNIYKSVRNIPDVKLINYKGTNVYDLIRFKNVIFTKSSIKNIEQRLTNEKN